MRAKHAEGLKTSHAAEVRDAAHKILRIKSRTTLRSIEGETLQRDLKTIGCTGLRTNRPRLQGTEAWKPRSGRAMCQPTSGCLSECDAEIRGDVSPEVFH